MMFWDLGFLEIMVISSVMVNLGLMVFLALLFIKVEHMGEASDHNARTSKHARARLSKKVVDTASLKLNEVVDGVAKTLQKELEENMTGFSKDASAQIQKLAKSIAVQEEFILKESQLLVAKIVNDARIEADDYKNRQLEKASKLVYEVVMEASKQVIGKTINPGEHQSIVEQAIERAKRDKFFS